MTESLFRREAGPREKTWDAFRCAMVLWLALLATVGLVALLSQGRRSAQQIVIVDVVFATIVVVLSATVWDEIRPLFARFATAGWRTVPWTVGTFAAIAAFMAGYKAVATAIGFRYVSVAEEYRGTGWQLWAVLVSVAVVPAVFEETAFRAVIQTGMERLMPSRDALIVQAAMFSVLHLIPAMFVSHFVIGLFLGILRRRTGSVYPGMLVHGAWNATVLLTAL